MSATSTLVLPRTSRLDGPTPLIISRVDDRAIRRAAERGELVTLARGCHVDAGAWAAADWDERFRLRIQAARRVTRGDFVLSHAAAAFAWGLPWVGPWPARVDITDPSRSTTRSGVVTRCRAAPLGVGEVCAYHGVAITTPARTVVDIALTIPFAPAVAIADGALNTKVVDSDALCDAIARRSGSRTFASASRVVEFADPGADSAAESVSRVTAHRMGAPRPVLQRRFHEAHMRAYVDMWWQDEGIAGECDGDKKYLRPEFRKGRTIEQVHLDEKKRGDWLQSQREVRRLARWGWREAGSVDLLGARLTAAGLSLGRARRPGDPW